MIKNLVKKLLLGLSLAGIMTFTAAASSCAIESAHPGARITVEFNSETYELNYTLYRNMYPNTVRHFIELADSKVKDEAGNEKGFYEDMLVHNYGTQDWYSGAYTYDAEKYSAASTPEAFSQYLEDVCKEGAYMELFKAGKLTPTVYSHLTYDEKKGEETVSDDEALPTLIGEFYNNISQEIESGALDDEFGTLKMFYYQKSTKGKIYVTPTSDQIIPYADYKYNCATSIFSMQVGSSSSLSAENYAVFGRINNVSKLDELLDDISDYLSENYGDSLTGDQTYEVRTTVDNEVEEFSTEADDKGREQTFRITKAPIIIKSVKITKY